MVSPGQLLEFFEERGVSFYTGVPDSLLQAFCIEVFNRYGENNSHHIVAVNEGNAVALGAGYHLATGNIPLVYLQNSGLGNAVNPATSLADPAVYGIPILYIVGWRGEPGVHDEPQHVKQGEITCDLLEVLGIPYIIVDKQTTTAAVTKEFSNTLQPYLSHGQSVALVVRKGAFEKPEGSFPEQVSALDREFVIKKLADGTSAEDFVISTTGKISRELFEHRKTSGSSFGSHDFLTVGSMGHASAIALSISVQHPKKTIWCFDGDGAMLMHMGAMATIGGMAPNNLLHVVLNNGSHESVGGMPTIARNVDLLDIATACGYKDTYRIRNQSELDIFLKKRKQDLIGPIFIEIIVSSGSRPELIRPDSTPEENKLSFMSALQGR